MKKGLSVLLIAAALFGFYGGATSLNDILASKDYWEEVGEKSTADMNKLEDGLNQLKDNEKAYLDGQKELADGEVKLADAEVQLADGEAKLAAGKAELAQGYADYAAAPAKLADAEKQLADGKAKLSDAEDQLEEGESSIKKLGTAITGVNQIINGYNNTWKPGYDTLKEARAKIYGGTKNLKDQMLQLAAFLDPSLQKAYVAAVNDVAGDDEKQTADDYKDFIAGTNTLAKDIPLIQNAVKEKLAGAKQIQGALASAGNNLTFAGTVANSDVYPNLLAMSALITDSSKKAAFEGAVKATKVKFETYSKEIENKVEADVAAYLSTPEGKQAVGIELAKEGIVPPESATPEQQQHAAKIVGAKYAKDNKLQDKETAVVAGEAQSDAELSAYASAISGAVDGIVTTLEGVNSIVNGDKVNKELLPGLKQFNAAATADKIDELAKGQDDMANGIRTIASGVLANKTLKDGVKKEMGQSAIALLNVYNKTPNPANTAVADFSQFEKQMDSTPGLLGMLLKSRSFLGKTKADGIKTYNAGLKEYKQGKATYNAGLAEYKQGLADYAAAPAKLADGEKQVADGEAELADGYKQYEDGKKQLEDGKKKLAEYEDGEQQVRDGLATLMATEADPGLKSILERRNGDDKFDDENGHLNLNEGLEAVETGRGYQAESGDLITKEITNRAVGTAAGIGAGVLAVLAAILSFLKKNKGAAVSAVLAAVAGGVGTGVGLSAGEYYSDIAGSTIGNTPFIAAAILAAVAAVFAIVHFAAKPEAK